ncbi:MAG: Ig-like domain-containing protein, partial [Lachnospiraceae bacterium]|nr:Ig-like domain-containing protein [Lachnospiraceae bacterium]
MKVSKKLITKSIITTMLTLGMMFALAAFIPGSVLRANAETNYPLYIGGYQFTSSRLVIDSSVDSAFSGSATYDPGSNTLMLNNFNNGGKVSEEGNKCYGMRYQGNDDLMICIVGNNTITTDTIPSVGPSKWGIISQSDQADITFQGTTIDDSLSVYSGDSILSSVITQSIGIEAAGNMLINDCSINAIAGNANSWIGGIKIFDSGHPFAHLNLTVDHACVTARGGNLLGDGSVAGDRFTATVGIHSNYSIIIQNESIVVASAGTKNKTDSSSDGISASNEIQISNSKVDAAAQGGIAIYNTFKNEVPGLGWTNFLGTEGETSIQVNPSGQTHYTFQKVHFAPINTVTVTNGTCVGGDDHEYGETVTITANAPAAGYVFDHWSTSSGVTFANANSSTTTFAMPAAPVSVTANYRELDRATVAQIPTAKTGLTVNGSAQALINGGSATGGTLVYALGNADSATGTYSETIPTEMNAGTYYVWYKVVGDSNHNDTEAKMLTVQIAEKKNENDDPNKPDPDNPDTPDPKPAAIPVTSISLNITDASVTLKKGATLTLTAAVLPENASDKSVEWSVVDPSVASVSGGTVTANDKGKTKVTVTTKDGGFTASCQILVVSDELLPEVVEKIEPDKTYTDEADKPVAPAPEVPEPVKVSDEVTIPLTYGD